MDLLNILSNVFGGDLVTIILKLVFGLGIGIGAFFFMRWIKGEKDAAANTATQQDRTDTQSQIDDQNKTVGQDGQSSEGDIENIIKNKKP